MLTDPQIQTPGPRFAAARVVCAGAAPDEAGQAAAISDALGVTEVTARILVRRGISSPAEARAFVSPTLRDCLPDPNLIKNIQEAAELLLSFVATGKLITIYSDFDVDGLTSGAQLWMFLKQIGANVNSYTPNRFSEGYGLVRSAVEKLAEQGTRLLVTVDCGISSIAELTIARRKGLKTIVLDHHQVGTLPPADVIVDPEQDGCPFKPHALCAAGLVWMLLIVLRKQAALRLGLAEEKLPDPKSFLDLAALGTVCDMVPLCGLNRVIASRGLEAMRRSERPGLRALMQVSGIEQKKLTCGQIGFVLGPRINASGRMTDAQAAFELLTTRSESRAKAIAAEIHKLNADRKQAEEEVRRRCHQLIESSPDGPTAPAFALCGDDFHIGVIGIVAQRLVDRYYRPAAVMAPSQSLVDGIVQEVIKGSVRGVPGFHVAEVLHSLKHLLINGGGHAQAGGFSVSRENLPEFQQGFIAAAHRLIGDNGCRKERHADLQLDFTSLSYDVARELALLGPFGIGNPTPLLVTENIQIEAVTSVGTDGLKLRLSDGGNFMPCLAWGFRGHPLLKKGAVVNAAYHAELSSFRGVTSVQLNLKEVWTEG